ncbi:transposase [Methylorubrum extorquens]
MAETGVGPLYHLRYSPNFYPIERAFAKLNSRLRTAAARTLDDLHDAIRKTLGQFTSTECTNHIEAAGYENDLALEDNQMPL